MRLDFEVEFLKRFVFFGKIILCFRPMPWVLTISKTSFILMHNILQKKKIAHLIRYCDKTDAQLWWTLLECFFSPAHTRLIFIIFNPFVHSMHIHLINTHTGWMCVRCEFWLKRFFNASVQMNELHYKTL